MSIATLITENKSLRDNLTKALHYYMYIATRSYGHIGYNLESLASLLADPSEDETDFDHNAMREIRNMERPPTRTYVEESYTWHAHAQ